MYLYKVGTSSFLKDCMTALKLASSKSIQPHQPPDAVLKAEGLVPFVFTEPVHFLQKGLVQSVDGKGLF